MWRTGQDAGASNTSTPGPKSTGPHGKGNSEMLAQPANQNVSQHPASNPTPFSAFPTAWAIGTSPVEYANLARPNNNSMHPPSIVYAPSDLLPHGLLASPQPSTPATTLLKLVANRSLSIVNPDAAYGPNANGESPAAPGAPPLDTLILPSPSLLPGGVHSLPTPTSSSQLHRPQDGYGYGSISPVGTGPNKDIPVTPKGDPANGSKGPSVVHHASGKRLDVHAPQAPRGSSSGGAANHGRNAEGAAPSRDAGLGGGSSHSSGSQQASLSGGYTGGGVQQQGRGMHPVGSYPMAQHHHYHHHAVKHHQSAPTSGASMTPGSPSAGYPGNAYYMAPLPPGAMVMPMHQSGGGGNAGNGRASAGGGTITAPRDSSAGSGWRGSRSAGGAAMNGAAANGHCTAKHSHQYVHQQQQMMQGSMASDGSGAYGMAHMHAGPYALYGMMAPGRLVMPQVMSPVVGSPRGMDAHSNMAHQHSHMGPMMMSHSPSMAMGMGMGMAPMHGYPSHGHMAAPHIGLHPMTHHHPAHMGAPHGISSYPHSSAHSMPGGGFQGGHYGAGVYGQHPYGHMHAGVSYGRSGAGKATAGAGGVGQQLQAPGAASVKNSLPHRGAAAESGAASGGAAGANGSGRDSPAAARGRGSGRDKLEKSRASEQRERKSGNSRAPAAVAQCAAEVAALDEQLRNLVQQLTPGAEELEAHQTALHAVRQLVEARWPDVKVHLFGSAANGLCIAGANEIDITLEVPDMVWDDHAAKAAMVSELGELATGGRSTAAAAAAPTPAASPEADATPAAADAEVITAGSAPEAVSAEATEAGAVLEAAGDGAIEVDAAATATADSAASEEANKKDVTSSDSDSSREGAARATGMTAVTALPKARTPVVKLTVAETKTRVDITVNNLLALSNTRMLGHYCQLDPRLKQLVLVVKHWAKTRSVNDAYRGSLSSYAYVLLCIWLLQQRQPPILPVLQQRDPLSYDTTVGPWRCSYHDAVQDLRDFGTSNKESLAELLVAFFDHWAWRHDYNGSVVCVRTGGTLAKSAKEWTKRQGNERHLMCIEDPFELSHDLGRTIDKAAVQILRREFERAARIFASSSDPLRELLAPLSPEEEALAAAAMQSRRKASKDKDKDKQAAKEGKLAAAAAAGDGDGGVGVCGVASGEQQSSGDASTVVSGGEGGVSSAEIVLTSRGSGSEEQDTEEE
ncbi:hypothetical protein Agub_g11094, partial [Astrephomene gubernaculifera]